MGKDQGRGTGSACVAGQGDPGAALPLCGLEKRTALSQATVDAHRGDSELACTMDLLQGLPGCATRGHYCGVLQ